ncbi:MAG: type I methionyl aminopeptidase [Thermodesulfovibrionales bacterium]|nr:type I methionyl aminopeptidase [Thermodesulfovibrionales bacterium]
MIIIKTPQEIEKIRKACRIVAQILEKLKGFIRANMTTADIEDFIVKEIKERGGKPAFKGYRGYPANACISVNDVVIHGIPSKNKKVKDGDIVGVDIGVYLDGYFGDGAYTYQIGRIDDRAARLLKVTEEALYKGIEKAVVGNRISDISYTIQRYVEDNGFSVVRNFVGHGIGTSLHEEPQVPNFGKAGQGCRIREGMTLAIEPMVNEGKSEVKVLSDGWTAVTQDGSLSAHFEHTIAVTKNGPEILTKTE